MTLTAPSQSRPKVSRRAKRLLGSVFSARLGVAQPALRDQIIEEGMESSLADMRGFLTRKREGDGRVLGR